MLLVLFLTFIHSPSFAGRIDFNSLMSDSQSLQSDEGVLQMSSESPAVSTHHSTPDSQDVKIRLKRITKSRSQTHQKSRVAQNEKSKRLKAQASHHGHHGRETSQLSGHKQARKKIEVKKYSKASLQAKHQSKHQSKQKFQQNIHQNIQAKLYSHDRRNSQTHGPMQRKQSSHGHCQIQLQKQMQKSKKSAVASSRHLRPRKAIALK